jgi:hydrogenase expression/formation protein HypC
MCIAHPMQVLAAHGGMATCRDASGQEVAIDLSLVGEVPAGAWLLCFLGAAREVIPEQRALDIRRALGALEGAMRGDTSAIDAAFPDLVGREPQLPDFLRTENH